MNTITKFSFTIDGLKLPTLNKVIRWDWRARKREVDRVRLLVGIAANKAGYGCATPLRRASVSIRAYGPYERRDSDATYFKNCLDSIVARPIAGTDARRWGLVLDDNRATIGEADCGTVIDDVFKVVIEVVEAK